ncbi:hypothetical protein [Gracilibacillus alcaliphilus]|nr:hypothetical protein [Gracilibacillus alcaliphilus]MBM7677579.1 hypothetical protein [Gracilibacillus alcaliphilus]
MKNCLILHMSGERNWYVTVMIVQHEFPTESRNQMEGQLISR